MEGVEEKMNKKKNPIDENYAVNVVYPCSLDQTLRTATVTSIGIRSNLGRARSVFYRSERVPGPAPPVRSEAASCCRRAVFYEIRSFGRTAVWPIVVGIPRNGGGAMLVLFFSRSIGRARKHIGSAAPLPS